MRTRYIYLTGIVHPNYGMLYYIGQHSWDGVGPDPKYQGSCQYRYYKSWLNKYWNRTRVIIYTSKTTTDKLEQYFINKCLSKHGSFIKGTKVNADKTWLSQFQYGTCLNGRISNMDQLRTAESIKKGNKTKWNNMSDSDRVAKMNYIRSCKTKESIANMVKHMPWDQRSINRRKSARKVLLSDGFIGCSSEVLKHLNLKSTHLLTDAFRYGYSYHSKLNIAAVPEGSKTLEELIALRDKSYIRYIEILRNRGRNLRR